MQLPGGRCSLRSRSFSVLCSFAWFLFLASVLFDHGARAQPPQTPTDPLEVRALESLFVNWTISSAMSLVRWNISNGNPCTGAAVNASISIDDNYFNPAIKCDCTFRSGTNTTCHIVELKVQKPKMVDGPFPEYIKSLTRLNVLKLQGNYISGPLPDYIWDMSTLKHLNLSSNLLSGVIPASIGNLQELISLDFSMNNFHGPLTKELGNLTNLLNLHLNSLGPGVNGSIPDAFSKLKKLQTMWISDNAFTGKIPEFIGSFINLEDLRLQGNSFQGPIPQTFSALTNLRQLRIGEVQNGSSKLEFIENMTALVILIIRNSDIDDSLPLKIGNYKLLEHMDLSFNKLSGSLPQALFDLPLLEYLFLGNNNISGSLPEKRNAMLKNIDLSYNDLSGMLPSWVTEKEPDLNINLVANNFTNPGKSLCCLQKGFPCRPDSSPFYAFSINCGGKQELNIPPRAKYEADNATLSTASYYVNNRTTTKWGVSSVGRYIGVLYPSYTQEITSRFANAPNNELFQEWRLSPSSLRYYGLGLMNGRYKVYFHFAETRDWDTRKGRRLFDIFIQGDRVEKDFDISRNVPGGDSLYAIQRNYTVDVTSNVLEIHLFWAGKGTCCVPNEGVYGPSISGISVEQQFDPWAFQKKRKHLRLIAGILVPTLALLFIVIAVIVLRWRKRQSDLDEDGELMDVILRQHAFSYAELKNATEDFNLNNKLGEGGSGIVYKGTLYDGRSVAVKQLFVSSIQGRRQFATEVATISSVQHRNLVKLFGCCYEGRRRLLVYEYLANGSLDQVLFVNKTLHLDWPARFGICLDTARGLAYLHEESSPRIVHRDVKASNILLDIDLNPKIADFGLAKLYDKSKTHITTGVAGTVGYLAPEYAMRGQLTEKADVFAFGVVALEVLSGRRNTEPELGPEKMYLLEWTWHLHAANTDLEIIDPSLETYNEDEALRIIKVAFMCTQASPTKRPSMSAVVSMLVGDMKVSEIVSKPSYLMGWWAADVNDSNFMTSTVSDHSNAAWASSTSFKPVHPISGGR